MSGEKVAKEALTFNTATALISTDRLTCGNATPRENGVASLGEDGSPFIREVGPDRDRGLFFAFGNDLEEQLGAFGVDLDVSEFIGLYGCRHRSIYADTATMPRVCVFGSYWRDDAGVLHRLTSADVGIVAA